MNPPNKLLDRTLPLWLALALLALWIVLRWVLPSSELYGELQRSRFVKQGLGYALLVNLILLWALALTRWVTWFDERRNFLAKLHRWIAVSFLLMILLHANLKVTGYLGLQVWVIVVLSLASVVALLWQDRMGQRLKNRLLALHVVLACLMSAVALVHVYFVWAYTA